MVDPTLLELLPPNLSALARLAGNLWWTWNEGGESLFRDLAPHVWRDCLHNPLALLRRVSADRFSQLSVDPSYLGRLERLSAAFDAYMREAPGAQTSTTTAASDSVAQPLTWAHRHLPDESDQKPVAYFCAEFGLHESLRLYSGGLGILAGDHLKAASDLGLPLVAIGLLYRNGYFSQRISTDGWQREVYDDADFDRLPLELVRDAGGAPLLVEVPIRGRAVKIQVWRADVGRVRLFLLDSDVEGNEAIDRWITSHLYGGDSNTRIVQEIVLGIGGVRALRAMRINPSTCHLNEGHSAFLVLEMIRERLLRGMTLDDACAWVRERTVFTTHTPVPAGNDVFEISAMRECLQGYLDEFGGHTEALLGLGRRHPGDEFEPFGMTPLAIRLSRSSNAVSDRHREVCARMWSPLWPERSVEESPFKGITNGVHLPTWIAPLMGRLYAEHLGQDWRERMDDPDIWTKIDQIPDGELWRIHGLLRSRLVAVARDGAEHQWRRAGESERLVQAARTILDPNVLTVGFARRIAGYKRWDLLLSDMDRALSLLNHPQRPIQLVLAGKAHPRDNEAKRVLQQILAWRGRPELLKRVIFLEGYDHFLGRKLVQGVDVWLNLPVPPLEASGTSGMKVVMNGGLNLSVLDGWWCEAWDGQNGNGWAIGEPWDPASPRAINPSRERDQADTNATFDLLEHEIAPLFYDRDRAGIPRGWVARMKNSLRTLAPRFSARRMVKEYAGLYWPGVDLPRL